MYSVDRNVQRSDHHQEWERAQDHNAPEDQAAEEEETDRADLAIVGFGTKDILLSKGQYARRRGGSSNKSHIPAINALQPGCEVDEHIARRPEPRRHRQSHQPCEDYLTDYLPPDV